MFIVIVTVCTGQEFIQFTIRDRSVNAPVFRHFCTFTNIWCSKKIKVLPVGPSFEKSFEFGLLVSFLLVLNFEILDEQLGAWVLIGLWRQTSYSDYLCSFLQSQHLNMASLQNLFKLYLPKMAYFDSESSSATRPIRT